MFHLSDRDKPGRLYFLIKGPEDFAFELQRNRHTVCIQAVTLGYHILTDTISFS